ncbi:MAG: BrnT family toxin [Thermodesulfovibrionales bacterium]|nr:BrnT family toxin [Thermodesulfovibrionales bacterium]
MKFEWDTEKEKTNRKKHGVAFQEACYVFADKFMLTLYDERHSDAEDRWITIGQSLNNRVIVVIHTHRKTNDKDAVRIISARKATKHEEKQYLKRRG